MPATTPFDCDPCVRFCFGNLMYYIVVSTSLHFLLLQDEGKKVVWGDCLRRRSSVTRFGEIPPIWQNFKIIMQFLRVQLVLGKLLKPLWQIFYTS